VTNAVVARALSFLVACVWLGAAVAADASPVAAARPAGQVRGTISYGRHIPAIGAVVILRPAAGSTPVYAATTGASGAFGFDGVPDGTYRAEVRRDGYTTQQKSGIVVRAPFRAVVELTLAPGTPATSPPSASAEGDAALAGRVRIAGGAPIAEVRARIVRPDAADDPRTALTDASGGFVFPGLKAGLWRLEISGAGLLPLRTEIDLSGEVVLEAALAQQPANYQPPAQDLIVPEDVIPPKR
jgi:hypothetical protein